MKNILPILFILLTGCASTGNHVANGGQHVGKIGSGILIMSGFNPLFWPLAPTSIPFYAVAFPMYYGGCAIAKQPPEKDPFDP